MEHTWSPVAVVGYRVADVRKRRGMTQKQLAEHLQAEGVPWERVTVAKLETGKRTNLSVIELLALGYALNVAPVHLLIPPEGDDLDYQVTPRRSYSTARVRNFVRGYQELPDRDWREFMVEMPEGDALEFVSGRQQYRAHVDQEGGDDNGPGS